TLTTHFSVGDKCMLDFGVQPLSIASGGALLIGANTVTLSAGSLTVMAGGQINGLGSQSGPPGSVGGEIGIITTGPVTIDKSGTTNGIIDVSATTQAGIITITAGGPLALNGRLNADALAANGVGGFITLGTTGKSSD